MADMRQFDSGATRNVDTENFDFEGFLCPLVLDRFAAYMHKHRKQADGKLRASDNWQKGIPLDSYMKSGYRHFHDWCMAHRGYESRDGLEEGICALMFKAMGYLHEVLKARGYKQKDVDVCQEKQAGPSPNQENPRSHVSPLPGMLVGVDWRPSLPRCGEQPNLPREGTGCACQTDVGKS